MWGHYNPTVIKTYISDSEIFPTPYLALVKISPIASEHMSETRYNTNKP